MEIQGYNMPDDLYYDEYHFWVRVEGDMLVMGMNDFAQQLAGQIVYVQLPFEGKAVQAGKKFAKVESGKWLGTVYGPVDGEIAVCNQELSTDRWTERSRSATRNSRRTRHSSTRTATARGGCSGSVPRTSGRSAGFATAGKPSSHGLSPT
jgi:hypothetical protein